MTSQFQSPIVELPGALSREFVELVANLGPLNLVEELALAQRLGPISLGLPAWERYHADVATRWKAYDHVIVRGLLPAGDGATLILGALVMGGVFRTYRGNQIVKRFTMSPWTRALSHTIAEGHFHTDLNTEATPPAVTAIQCVRPDPDTPRAGELRVARLGDLIEVLEHQGAHATLRFLRDLSVTMVNDTDNGHWRGRIVENGTIRYHPETLRAGQRRRGDNPPDMEFRLAEIKQAALDASSPIHLEVGDALIVSNRRALHYRGACTVRFRAFPRDFESRSVNVLHLMDKPK